MHARSSPTETRRFLADIWAEAFSALQRWGILPAPPPRKVLNRGPDITKGIQSLTSFRRRSGDFMKQLKKSNRPVVLTVKGKAAAIVQDAEAYQRLLDALAPPEKYSTTSAENMTYLVEFAARASG
jgi:PHD/YefM family antitoxin component YafN of YafNO toxin-antitoxin module